MKQIFVIILLFFCESFGWRIFNKGRMVGGNLGEPISKKGLRDTQYFDDLYFKQILDHSDPTNGATWDQRYFVNDEYFKQSGPVFLMIGGEGEASSKWMTQGAWIDYAYKYGALLFQLEHRFYGKSHPTPDMSTESLKFLTSEQALNDLANFITEMNKKYNLPKDVKWIAFGGSYPGSLAAWLRFKYPHLVHGAVSSSGPLEALGDFANYFKNIVGALETQGSPECVQKISEGTNQLEVMLTEPIGQKNLNSLFKLCDRIQDSIDDINDVSNFFETLADNFAGIVQYNKDNRVGNSPGKNITIDVVCDIMTNSDLGPQVNRLASVSNLLLETYDQKCLDYKYNKMLDTLRNVSWEGTASEGGRQWTYQTCTEFGFYQTSSLETNVFGDRFDYDFFVKQCSDIFGDNYNENLLENGINRTNTIYGAKDIEVSRVVFIHGTVDPWRSLGITKTLHPEAPAILIEGTAHCANMYPEGENDPPQLTAARKQINTLIGEWLKV